MPRGRSAAAAKSGVSSDQEILQRVARGDPDAMQPLFQRFSGRAFGICLRILRNRAEAEEVLQETLMEIWRRAREYDPTRGGPEGWIATISRTRAIDHLRSQRTAQRVAEAARPESLLSVPPAAPDVSASEGQDRARIDTAMKALPQEQRLALELAYFEGLSHSEIAKRTGDPLGTVKTRVRLGMEKLAEMLQKRE